MTQHIYLIRAGFARVGGCEDLCFLQTGQCSMWRGVGNSLLFILYEYVPENNCDEQRKGFLQLHWQNPSQNKDKQALLHWWVSSLTCGSSSVLTTDGISENLWHKWKMNGHQSQESLSHDQIQTLTPSLSCGHTPFCCVNGTRISDRRIRPIFQSQSPQFPGLLTGDRGHVLELH